MAAVEQLSATSYEDPRVQARVELAMVKEIQKTCKVPPKIARDVALAFYAADLDGNDTLSEKEFKQILELEGKSHALKDVWAGFIEKVRNSPRARYGYEVEMIAFAKWYLNELPNIPTDEEAAVGEHRRRMSLQRSASAPELDASRDRIAKALFEAIDTNHNHLIDKSEILSAQQQLVNALPFDLVELWTEGTNMRKADEGNVNLNDWMYLMKGLEEHVGKRKMKKALSSAAVTLCSEEALTDLER